MINFLIKPQGLDELQDKLAEIEKLVDGKQPFKGVQLLDIPRNDDGDPNSEILEKLDKKGFRFALLDRSEEQEIVAAFEAVVEERLRGPNPKAADVAANALRAAIAKFGEIVVRHIEEGTNVTGDLSPGYKVQKLREHGFIYPIGKATAQLISNLTGGKVRLTTR